MLLVGSFSDNVVLNQSLNCLMIDLALLC